MATSRLLSRNIVVQSRRTTMRMEPEFWNALQEIGRRERLRLSELADRAMLAQPAGGCTSAVRVFVLAYFRGTATASETID
jgi:predicted DNA-binding ribbon-helix-helix protein